MPDGNEASPAASGCAKPRAWPRGLRLLAEADRGARIELGSIYGCRAIEQPSQKSY